MAIGRPKGAKNLNTEAELQFRDSFKMYCYSGGFEKFKKELEALKGRNYVESFLKALEFAEPKLARHVDKNGDDVKQPSLTVVFTDGDKDS
jgi:hypothetical protein